MIVTWLEHGVRIDLNEPETFDLAAFLAQCDEGDPESVVDQLAAKLNVIVNGPPRQED